MEALKVVEALQLEEALQVEANTKPLLKFMQIMKRAFTKVEALLIVIAHPYLFINHMNAASVNSSSSCDDDCSQNQI